MNKLIKLSKLDIQNKYLNKPILITCQDSKEWYIISDVYSSMPLHMLSDEESDLYDQDENNIEGIKVAGVNGDGYLMWIYFETNTGWEAYGYE
jgi:hypothetical protein